MEVINKLIEILCYFQLAVILCMHEYNENTTVMARFTH